MTSIAPGRGRPLPVRTERSPQGPRRRTRAEPGAAPRAPRGTEVLRDTFPLSRVRLRSDQARRNALLLGGWIGGRDRRPAPRGREPAPARSGARDRLRLDRTVREWAQPGRLP